MNIKKSALNASVIALMSIVALSGLALAKDSGSSSSGSGGGSASSGGSGNSGSNSATAEVHKSNSSENQNSNSGNLSVSSEHGAEVNNQKQEDKSSNSTSSLSGDNSNRGRNSVNSSDDNRLSSTTQIENHKDGSKFNSTSSLLSSFLNPAKSTNKVDDIIRSFRDKISQFTSFIGQLFGRHNVSLTSITNPAPGTTTTTPTTPVTPPATITTSPVPTTPFTGNVIPEGQAVTITGTVERRTDLGLVGNIGYLALFPQGRFTVWVTPTTAVFNHAGVAINPSLVRAGDSFTVTGTLVFLSTTTAIKTTQVIDNSL